MVSRAEQRSEAVSYWMQDSLPARLREAGRLMILQSYRHIGAHLLRVSGPEQRESPKSVGQEASGWACGTDFLSVSILRQDSVAHEVFIDLARNAASFVDGPDDQRLTAAVVAGHKDLIDVGGVDFVFGLKV